MIVPQCSVQSTTTSVPMTPAFPVSGCVMETMIAETTVMNPRLVWRDLVTAQTCSAVPMVAASPEAGSVMERGTVL